MGGPINDPFPYRETPTLPADPQPLPASAPAVPADDGGSGEGVWLLLGAGLVAAGIAGGSAAGMARATASARVAWPSDPTMRAQLPSHRGIRTVGKGAGHGG